MIDPDGMAPGDPEPGFWGSFFRSVGRGVGKVISHVVNNPNHAGYGYSPNMKTPKPNDFGPYQINWRQQLDPTWQAQNFSSMAVYGVSGFVGGIIDGDGARTAQSIPKLFGTVGFLSLFKSKGIKNVDLMGGSETSMKGFKNFDLADNGLGINDFVSNFGKYFKPGSLKNVIVNNPQATFLEEIYGSLSKGGQVTVSGTVSNKYFKSIWNGNAKGLDGYKILKRVENISKDGMFQSDGVTSIKGNVNQIILQKK